MKLKQFFNLVVNKSNNQIVLTSKKKMIRKFGFEDTDELLEMEVEERIKKGLYRK